MFVRFLMDCTFLATLISFVTFIRTDGPQSVTNGTSINCLIVFKLSPYLVLSIDKRDIFFSRQLQLGQIHMGSIIIHLNLGAIEILCYLSFEPVNYRLIVYERTEFRCSSHIYFGLVNF